MFSWLCRKCDKEMFSSDPGRKEKEVICIHCGAKNINPYYVKEENGGGENDESVSVGAGYCVPDEGECCGEECCGEPEQSMNEQVQMLMRKWATMTTSVNVFLYGERGVKVELDSPRGSDSYVLQFGDVAVWGGRRELMALALAIGEFFMEQDGIQYKYD